MSTNGQIRAAAERERRRRVPAVIQWDGRIYHRGKEISEDELGALRGDGITAIDFRPPSDTDADA